MWVGVIWKVSFCIASNSNLVSCARPLLVEFAVFFYFFGIRHRSMAVCSCCHFHWLWLFCISCARSIRFFPFIFDCGGEMAAAVPIASSVCLWTEKLFSFHVNIFWNEFFLKQNNERERRRNAKKSTLVTRRQIQILCSLWAAVAAG